MELIDLIKRQKKHVISRIILKKSYSSLQRETIALLRLDGLGGTITLTDQAKKLYDITGKPVTLITRGYESLFESNPHINNIVNVGMKDWQECSLVMRNRFDMLAEIRFAPAKWYNRNGDIQQHRGKFDTATPADERDEYETLFKDFPIGLKQLDKYNLHHIQLTDKILGLPYDTIETKVFADEAFECPNDFLLINNGVDTHYKGLRQTKCWNGWDKFVELVDISVVQVGMEYDLLVEKAIDLRGRTNLKQLIYLIKKARAIIVGEGGIMHLAYAAGNPNVIVIVGPTNSPLFKYPGHRWIESYVCGNCWSATDDWFRKCPKDVKTICMNTIIPERVVKVYENMVSD